jgi:hypothetical protein
VFQNTPWSPQVVAQLGGGASDTSVNFLERASKISHEVEKLPKSATMSFRGAPRGRGTGANFGGGGGRGGGGFGGRGGLKTIFSSAKKLLTNVSQVVAGSNRETMVPQMLS